MLEAIALLEAWKHATGKNVKGIKLTLALKDAKNEGSNVYATALTIHECQCSCHVRLLFH